MARRKRTAPSAEPTGPGLERRYLWLRRFMLAAEPGSAAADVADAIRDRCRRLDARRMSAAERVAELEAYLAELGVLEQATAFVDRFGPRPGRADL